MNGVNRLATESENITDYRENEKKYRLATNIIINSNRQPTKIKNFSRQIAK